MDKHEYMKRWLWHAFHGLDVDGTVDPQQLKILTAHVGASLGTQNKVNMAYKVGEKYRCDSTLAVCFSNYLEFLDEQGFLQNDSVDLKKLEETLWMICLKDYERRDHKVVATPELWKLWKIFNFLAEPDSFPICIDREEMELLMKALVDAMGTKWDEEHFEHVTVNLKLFTFTKMLICFESALAKGIDKDCVAEAVMEVYDTIIEEVEKKGLLFKKGHMIKNWKERWFILKPGNLSYYSSRKMKEKKGEINIGASWQTETLPDQKNYRNCLAIWTADKNDKDKTRYELSAADLRTRSAWMTALNAIFLRAKDGGLGQYGELLKRRELRRKRREQEEEDKRLQEDIKRKKEAKEREERLRQEDERKKAAKAIHDLERKREEERLRQQEAELDKEKISQDLKDTSAKLQMQEELRKEKEEEEEQRRLQDKEERERIQRERDEIERKQEEERRSAAEAIRDLERERDEETELRQQELTDIKAKLEMQEKQRKEKEEEEEQRRKREEEEREQIRRERDEIERAFKDAKEADRQRLAELEETLKHLQMLLEEERQARLEEQQAKDLQQRLLEEETKRREHLEVLKEEQARLLAQEQQRREDLEVKSEELTKECEMQEALLQEESVRLAELEEQRQAADVQLKAAMEKISITERNRAIIQKKREELSRTKTSMGLAQPIKPYAKPLVTHRGLPALSQEFEYGKGAVDGQQDANGHL